MRQHKKLGQLTLATLLFLIAGFAQAATVEFQVNWPSFARDNKIEFWNVAVDVEDRDGDLDTAETINSNLVTTIYGGENAICVPGFCSAPGVGNTSLTQTYTFNKVPPGNYRIEMFDSFGDGWNGGGNVTVFVNGTSIGTVSASGFGTSTNIFTISDPIAPTVTQTCSDVNLTGAWSSSGGTLQSTSGAIPIEITASSTGPGSWSFALDSMNTINAFSSSAVQGNTSLVADFSWDQTPGANGYDPVYQAVNSDGVSSNLDPGGIGSLDISFGGRTVNNAVVHLDRLGGVGGGVSNSARWSVDNAGVTLGRLAGVGHFNTYSNNSLMREMLVVSANTESSTNNATGTAAGSVVYQGEYSTLGFTLDGIGVEGAGGDAMELVVCVPQADLSLTKTTNNVAPNVGENVTFTLTVTNSGPDAANNIQVRDLLPAELDFVSSNPSQGSYASGSGIWDVGTIANGGSATLEIVASPNTAGVITNQAEIINSDRIDPDSEFRSGFGVDDLSDGIADDDEASVDISAGVVDISVTKSSLNDFVPGGSDTYTIVVTNAGPAEANNLAVSDNFPAGVTLNGNWTCTATAGSSCSSGSGGASGDSSISLNVSVIAGGQATITVPVMYSTDPADF
ncbi:hypothetical protein GCM10009123_04120 [Kangiella japonica]|uniref:DUF11 domain-containing protein n=1 Tax=Kangiella japonica TaxID=647384 RepID=A0ABN0SUA1_9GAMM